MAGNEFNGNPRLRGCRSEKLLQQRRSRFTAFKRVDQDEQDLIVRPLAVKHMNDECAAFTRSQKIGPLRSFLEIVERSKSLKSASLLTLSSAKIVFLLGSNGSK